MRPEFLEVDDLAGTLVNINSVSFVDDSGDIGLNSGKIIKIKPELVVGFRIKLFETAKERIYKCSRWRIIWSDRCPWTTFSFGLFLDGPCMHLTLFGFGFSVGHIYDHRAAL